MDADESFTQMCQPAEDHHMNEVSLWLTKMADSPHVSVTVNHPHPFFFFLPKELVGLSCHGNMPSDPPLQLFLHSEDKVSPSLKLFCGFGFFVPT